MIDPLHCMMPPRSQASVSVTLEAKPAHLLGHCHSPDYSTHAWTMHGLLALAEYKVNEASDPRDRTAPDRDARLQTSIYLILQSHLLDH